MTFLWQKELKIFLPAQTHVWLCKRFFSPPFFCVCRCVRVCMHLYLLHFYMWAFRGNPKQAIGFWVSINSGLFFLFFKYGYESTYESTSSLSHCSFITWAKSRGLISSSHTFTLRDRAVSWAYFWELARSNSYSQWGQSQTHTCMYYLVSIAVSLHNCPGNTIEAVSLDLWSKTYFQLLI